MAAAVCLRLLDCCLRALRRCCWSSVTSSAVTVVASGTEMFMHGACLFSE